MSSSSSRPSIIAAASSLTHRIHAQSIFLAKKLSVSYNQSSRNSNDTDGSLVAFQSYLQAGGGLTEVLNAGKTDRKSSHQFSEGEEFDQQSLRECDVLEGEDSHSNEPTFNNEKLMEENNNYHPFAPIDGTRSSRQSKISHPSTNNHSPRFLARCSLQTFHPTAIKTTTDINTNINNRQSLTASRTDRGSILDLRSDQKEDINSRRYSGIQDLNQHEHATSSRRGKSFETTNQQQFKPEFAPLTSIPVTIHPINLNDAQNTETPKEPVDKPAGPPPSILSSILTPVISTLFLSLLYIPFTIAILTQSYMHKKGYLPKDWQTELLASYWYFSFAYFLLLLCMPFILVYGALDNQGLFTIDSNDYLTTLPFTILLSIYLFMFTILHLLTIYYAHIREDLHTIHSDVITLRPNLSNVLSVIALIIETCQLILPFLSLSHLNLDSNNVHSSLDTGWIGVLHDIMLVTEIQLQEFNTYLVSLVICSLIVLFYALMLGYGIYSNMQPDHKLGPLLFSIIPGVFYLTVVSKFFSLLNCISSDGIVYTLWEDQNITCWTTSLHKSLLILVFISLLFYSSSAMFVACYRGDASGNGMDVKYKPIFLVIERTLRDLFAITTILISNNELSRSLSFVLLLVLCFFTYKLNPCSILVITRMKLLGQLLAIYLLLLTFLSDIFISYKDTIQVYFILVLVIGWVTLILLFMIYEINTRYLNWVKEKNQIHNNNQNDIINNNSNKYPINEYSDKKENKLFMVASEVSTLTQPDESE